MTQDKQNNRPNVPPLRFPGFTEPWQCKRLGDCCSPLEYGMNSAATSYDGTNKYIRITDIDEETSQYKTDDLVSPSGILDDKYLVKDHDILFARTGASTGKTYHYDPKNGRMYFAGFLIRANVNKQYNSRFVFYQTQLKRYWRWVQVMSTRSGQPGINSQEYEAFKLFLPSNDEQNKITDFISLLDRRIAIQSRVIERLQSLMGGITLHAVKSKDCENVHLKDILTERNERNIALNDVCSVSVTKGVVNQVEYLGRSFAAKNTSNYNVVHYGDIVYTKSPTGDFPFGIVKRSEQVNPVAVSPLYGVYQPASDDIGVFLHFYFCNPVSTKNYLHKLIQKGAKNTINITNQRFLENSICLPQKETLKKIVNLLSALSSKQRQEEHVLDLLVKQKQFLLNHMFI